MATNDLPRTPEGFVDFGVLFDDPEIQEALWRDAVPFWSVAARTPPEESGPAEPKGSPAS